MNYLHAYFSHFPAALICAAFVLHGIQIWRPYWMCRVIGFWLLGLSIPLNILASITGTKSAFTAGRIGLSTETLKLLKLHEFFGNCLTIGTLVLFLVWIYLFFRDMENKHIDKVVFAFLGLFTIIALTAGFVGTQLVFIHGVGTP